MAGEANAQSAVIGWSDEGDRDKDLRIDPKASGCRRRVYSGRCLHLCTLIGFRTSRVLVESFPSLSCPEMPLPGRETLPEREGP